MNLPRDTTNVAKPVVIGRVRGGTNYSWNAPVTDLYAILDETNTSVTFAGTYNPTTYKVDATFDPATNTLVLTGQTNSFASRALGGFTVASGDNRPWLVAVSGAPMFVNVDGAQAIYVSEDGVKKALTIVLPWAEGAPVGPYLDYWGASTINLTIEFLFPLDTLGVPAKTAEDGTAAESEAEADSTTTTDTSTA